MEWLSSLDPEWWLQSPKNVSHDVINMIFLEVCLGIVPDCSYLILSGKTIFLKIRLTVISLCLCKRNDKDV